MADAARQLRHVVWVDDLVLVTREHDPPAAVILVNDRIDAGAWRLGGGVDMGDEPDHRRVRGARKGREHVAVLRQLDVVEADLAKLAGEQPREIELLGGARIGRGALLRLRVDADVAEESLEHVGCQHLGER